ncbi:uncharacterized protein L969DRAFT_88149 [Mixia osmundae IAM 14324]|uniref:Protein CPL1-like domain-containing protein n=1 Tax=Mixia osmundae (strain CBS 9802 / IAM 14324 / JCM 22182 / KY 12970) TaxID=764103 RepID=G7E131_MIXOS|nr:uncharacterized protein L969DRAFT_88149 [Mixia osmundae IAM 14324]KEI38823.1 hypothetical protein L969DRAFT_88149 [Mixia osmundae IAM 14324]GAA96541.1 hypothetical protein E5Q_03209 [Mixia osmundae IAM 14324]
MGRKGRTSLVLAAATLLASSTSSVEAVAAPDLSSSTTTRSNHLVERASVLSVYCAGTSLFTPCPAPTNGVAYCTLALKCAFSCNTGYTVSGSSCVLAASSKAKARKKRDLAKETLCPTGESACPIAGSHTYQFASVFLDKLDSTSAMSIGDGLAWECIDPTSQIDSCGGCAARGEGTDCTSIPHSRGVGCHKGTCTVFSCVDGFSPSANATACQPIHLFNSQGIHAHPHASGHGHNHSNTHRRRSAHAHAHSGGHRQLAQAYHVQTSRSSGHHSHHARGHSR